MPHSCACGDGYVCTPCRQAARVPYMLERVHKVLKMLAAHSPLTQTPTSERAEFEDLMREIEDDISVLMQ